MTTPNHIGGLVTNLPAFYTSYPTPEARLETAARPLVVRKDPKTGFAGRDALAAHWGDTDEEYRCLAHQLDQLKFGADEAQGQAALVFHKGTPETALAETGIIANPVVVECGYIDTKILRTNTATGMHSRSEAIVKYEYVGNDGSDKLRAQPRAGVKPPYLAIGIGVVLTGFRTLEADLWTAKLSDPEPAPKPARTYAAVVSTNGDVELYRQTRTVVSRPFIFGNDKVRDFLQAVQARVRPDETGVDLLTSLLSSRKPIAAIAPVA